MRQDPHRPRHQRRGPLRIGHGDPLRHQLAHDQRQVGDDHDHDDEGHRLAIRRDEGDAIENDAELFGQRRAAIGAGEDADQRDADLHRREKPARIGEQIEGDPGAGAALGRERLEPRLPRGDDRQLRHGEHAVHHDEEENDQGFGNGHGGLRRTVCRICARGHGGVTATII